MYQGFPGDYDSPTRCSSSPSAESQYLSSVDSFSSPIATAASQECSGLGDMPGSFVPTVTAITTSQDLQWLVQPTLIPSMAQSQEKPISQPQPTLDLYDLPGTSYSTPGMSTYTRSEETISAETSTSSKATRTRSKKQREEALTPEEEEKRRVRRERNKMAAAKCRNRRKELTDRLQTETDLLEEEKAELEAEIAELQKEKDRLEFVLVAHKPSCKIPYEEEPLDLNQASTSTEVSCLGMVAHGKEDPFGPSGYLSIPLHFQQNLGISAQGHGTAEVAFSSSFYAHSEQPSDQYPVNPSYTSSFVFTYPEGSTCGVTHQRNSSSEQSSDSLNSPSLLAL